MKTKPFTEQVAIVIHVGNMAKTLMYALSLDRNVVLEDINIFGR